MDFGLFNLMTQRDAGVGVQQVVEDAKAMTRLADEIGFGTAWFAEHHFSNYSVCPSPLMMAAHCAGLTKTIRLGAAVLVLPLYDPLRLVQEIGLLDRVSGGRVAIGIGSGYQRFEFERYGRPLEEKQALFLEIWDILDQALGEGRLQHSGAHFQIPESPIAMTPAAPPPLYVTGLAPTVLDRALASGATPFITGGARGLPALRGMREAVVEAAHRIGLADPDRPPLAMQQYVFVTDDKAEAREVAERARYIGRVVSAMRAGVPSLDGPFILAEATNDEPSLEAIEDALVIGDAETVAEKMAAEIAELRPSHYSCFMQIASMPGAQALASLEKFGADVMPKLERALGPLDEIGRKAA
ncbi:MAG: LLM class flavin-dependent oxidoreductase [Marivibrio sp.]|uniref:LLM class flavin-dependent oxidoreductase n=1 Tax=Marivibrio sp. TaxID=2039719 RepID=UPI0032EF1F85